MQNDGAKSVATVYVNNDWGVLSNDSYVGKAKKIGLKVLTAEGITPGEKDFNAIVTKIKNLNPDAIYFAGQYAEAAALLNQFRRARFQKPFYASGTSESYELIDLAGKAAEGIFCPSLYFAGNPDKASKEFTEDYIAAYGSKPNMFSAMGHDAVLVAVTGARKAGGKRAEVAKNILQETGIMGATGKFDYKTSRDPIKGYVKLQVQNAKWVHYKK